MGRSRKTRKRNRARHPAVRFASAVVNAQIVAALALAAICYGGHLFGYEAMHVRTASMEPTIEAGSIAFVARTPGSAVQAGDIVAFSSSNDGATTILHRAEHVDAQAATITTKGDANNAADPFPVPFDAVVGTCAASIPRLGAIVETISSHRWAFVGTVALLDIALIAIAGAATARRPFPSLRLDWRRR